MYNFIIISNERPNDEKMISLRAAKIWSHTLLARVP